MPKGSRARCACARCGRDGPRSCRCGGGRRACARSFASAGASESRLAKVVAIAPDLMLGSRIEAGLGAAGHQLTVAASLSQAELEGAELVGADLDSEPPEPLAARGVPVLRYYRHTD